MNRALQTPLPEQTRTKMEKIIRDAALSAGFREAALVAMLLPGHGIPLTHTCGAVLDHDLVRVKSFYLGWGCLTGKILSEDYPEGPRAVAIPLKDIVWISPEIVEVK